MLHDSQQLKDKVTNVIFSEWLLTMDYLLEVTVHEFSDYVELIQVLDLDWVE